MRPHQRPGTEDRRGHGSQNRRGLLGQGALRGARGGKADEVIAAVEDALKGGAPVIWLTDKKGRRVGIPSDKVAYIEVAEEDAAKRVGFGPG